ncbi:hypothetical protein LG634_30430 [Streptomyces bambusae]|uniref:hypothetical protein n=1 Tax=Streptomyces bambusae TaxID=1550616 RepID=UPI001CFFDAAF|nr:hypothetical protein [Streptomyces bambusae]MCB5169112.1 hypothetical protein [Streptomyces bambusae]
MNIRSLTRGDGVVIGAAALLFIASFLDYYSVDGIDMPSAWDTDAFFLVLPSIFLLGFIGTGLLLAARFQPQSRQLLGLPMTAWGTVLVVAATWSSLWSLILSPDNGGLGAGAILAFLATLALTGATLFGSKVPALKGPLLPAPAPAAAAPFGGQPGQPGQQQPGGYGYPGQQQPFGGQQAGAPFGGQQDPAPQHGGPGPQHGGPGAQGGHDPLAAQPAPAAEFAAFWFAVPAARPLFAEDGSGAQIAELAPGTWYLAVDQRGPAALVAQTQDGRRGVLQDTSDIQRG